MWSKICPTINPGLHLLLSCLRERWGTCFWASALILKVGRCWKLCFPDGFQGPFQNLLFLLPWWSSQAKHQHRQGGDAAQFAKGGQFKRPLTKRGLGSWGVDVEILKIATFKKKNINYKLDKIGTFRQVFHVSVYQIEKKHWGWQTIGDGLFQLETVQAAELQDPACPAEWLDELLGLKAKGKIPGNFFKGPEIDTRWHESFCIYFELERTNFPAVFVVRDLRLTMVRSPGAWKSDIREHFWGRETSRNVVKREQKDTKSDPNATANEVGGPGAAGCEGTQCQRNPKGVPTGHGVASHTSTIKDWQFFECHFLE